MLMQNFGVTIKEHYGMLWYFLEWSIAVLFIALSCLINVSIFKTLGGVYMTPGRLSRRGEFTPVPSHGSTFVYMIPPQKVMPARIAPA